VVKVQKYYYVGYAIRLPAGSPASTASNRKPGENQKASGSFFICPKRIYLHLLSNSCETNKKQ
jgi:hypothetical protein